MEVTIPDEKLNSPLPMDLPVKLEDMNLLPQQSKPVFLPPGVKGPVRQAVESSNQAFSMLDEMTEMLEENVNGYFGGTIAMLGGTPAVAAMSAALLTSSTHNNNTNATIGGGGSNDDEEEDAGGDSSRRGKAGGRVTSPPSPPQYYPSYASSGACQYYDANFNWVGGVKGGTLKVAPVGSSLSSTTNEPQGTTSTIHDEVVLAEAAHQRGVTERAVRYCYPSFLRTIHRMEWIGGKVSWLLGLESGRFQYAVDEYNRQKDMKEHREAMVVKRKQEMYLAKGLEGMDDPSDDVSDLPYVPAPTC